MLTAEQQRQFHTVISETEHGKLEGVLPQTLRSYHKFLSAVQPHVLDGQSDNNAWIASEQ